VFALGALLGFAIVSLSASGSAVNPPGNEAHDSYRAPWRQGLDYWRNGGCPVNAPPNTGCTFHQAGTQYAWAIDLNDTGPGDSDCGDTLKATRAGSTIFYEPGEGAPSSYLGIIHATGSSWYTHVAWQNDAIVFRNGDWRPWDDLYSQGDLAARNGKEGTVYCHLHFFVTNGNQRYNQSVNVCLSGNCSSTGWDLQTLSNEDHVIHKSNNTGPGYGRPGAPAHLNPGPDGAPLSPSVRQFARLLVALGGEPGSTFASTQGPCAANRRWVKRCFFGYDGLAYTQNFLGSTGTLLLRPRSITEGPNGAKLVQEATWKAYGRECVDGFPTYAVVGRPLDNEADGTQPFSFGYIVRDNTDPTSATVTVYNNDDQVLCQFAGLKNWYTGPCYDVTGNAIVSSPDVFGIFARVGVSETSPAFDDRYDFNLDAAISASDSALVMANFGKPCD
jgi:hypothetical protein